MFKREWINVNQKETITPPKPVSTRQTCEVFLFHRSPSQIA